MSVSAASLNVGDTKELLLVDDLTRTQIVMYVVPRVTTTRCTPTRSSRARSPGTRASSPTACSRWA